MDKQWPLIKFIESLSVCLPGISSQDMGFNFRQVICDPECDGGERGSYKNLMKVKADVTGSYIFDLTNEQGQSRPLYLACWG